jgi:hydroxyacylglutathione hydrolase
VTMQNTATTGLTVIVDEGLGNSSYLLDLGDDGALAVDPSRDLRMVRAATERAGLRIRFVADTHLHADFLSGAAQLAHDDGATVLASAAGRRKFAHRGLVDGDEVDLGGLRLRALATPGHTDEHLALLLLDGSRPVGVFSGGSLIVGSAARTDLLGAERTEELARAQYSSLRRLATLSGGTALWPTHGAGSFCSAPPGAERTSTIGRELATNPLLAIDDEDAFVTELLGSLGSYPRYFGSLGEINRRGPAILSAAETSQLMPVTVSQLRGLQESHGAVVIDVRPITDYAAGHIPGAMSIPLRAQFATWLGWLTPPGAPVVIVRDGHQDAADILGQALKIGVELAGELAGGLNAWASAGQPVGATELIAPDQLGDRQVLDVRQSAEFNSGHIPATTHVELGELGGAADRLPDEPTVVMCGHGERAATAASLLERAGHRNLAILNGGPEDWATATGQPLDTGA